MRTIEWDDERDLSDYLVAARIEAQKSAPEVVADA
jgi:hypothetical protein